MYKPIQRTSYLEFVKSLCPKKSKIIYSGISRCKTANAVREKYREAQNTIFNKTEVVTIFYHILG